MCISFSDSKNRDYFCSMNPYQKVAFHTLGCKLNFSETSTIARSFEDAGYARVGFDEFADIYVINTCSVTENANKKTRYFINKAKQNNSRAKVVIVGCYAQLKPEEITKIDGVNLVLGANEKFDIVSHFESNKDAEKAIEITDRIGKVKEFIPSYSVGDRTRSFLKVQDGCDYYCSFCTIPLARGKSRNSSVASIVEKAEEIARMGVKEVVLTGVNIGDFGQGKGESFFDLIQKLDEVEGIERFRISSIEPNLLTDEIIEFVAQENKFVPHFHIPLQSGSDALLNAMKRKYDTKLYTERILKIKNLIPDCCIGVDVIVGFPGETDEEFLKTYDYLLSLPISYLHVFTYSERENTVALKMEGIVPKNIRQERNKMLRILSDKKKRAFYQSQIGKTQKVLFEAEAHEDVMFGFTENYVKVRNTYDETLINQSILVKMSGIDAFGDMMSEKIEVYA